MNIAASIALGTALSVVAGGQPVQWEGNGHWYEVVLVGHGIDWEEAQAAAAARGGYLATVTSVAESDWLYAAVVNDPVYWTFGGHAAGPYLGGFRGSNGWTWVTGEPWGFTSWDAGQPDNAPPGEPYLHYWNYGAPILDNTWNDIYGGGGGMVISYVIEWDQYVCDSDVNGDGILNTQDVLLFVGAYTLRDPLADWDDNGSFDSRDLLAFLNDYAAGC